MEEQQWLEDGWLFHNHAWHLLHEFLKNIPRGTRELLDVGGGTGLAASVIQAVFPGVVSHVTDITENSRPFWQSRGLFGYIVDGDRLPFEDNHFDVVMSSHVIEHLVDPAPLVAEMARVCNNRIIIAVPDGDVHFYDHKILFDRVKFQGVIETALKGFDYRARYFPVYHNHINNLMAVIDIL